MLSHVKEVLDQLDACSNFKLNFLSDRSLINFKTVIVKMSQKALEKKYLSRFILARVNVCAFVLIAEYTLITHFEQGHKLRPPRSLVTRTASQCYSSFFVDGQPPTGFRKSGINIRYIC